VECEDAHLRLCRRWDQYESCDGSYKGSEVSDGKRRQKRTYPHDDFLLPVFNLARNATVASSKGLIVTRINSIVRNRRIGKLTARSRIAETQGSLAEVKDEVKDRERSQLLPRTVVPKPLSARVDMPKFFHRSPPACRSSAAQEAK